MRLAVEIYWLMNQAPERLPPGKAWLRQAGYIMNFPTVPNEELAAWEGRAEKEG
jgi:hypothetical protein